MIKYSIRYLFCNSIADQLWDIYDESEARPFSSAASSPIEILADLMSANYLNLDGSYEYVDHRHHATVIDSVTRKPILHLEEV